MPVVNLTEQDDVQDGTDGADTIFGLGGNDSIDGAAGDDSLVGGDGDDTLRGDFGNDTIEGGAGNDEIEGLFGNDVINAGPGDDHVFARDDDDLVYGDDGQDTLIGGIGVDTLYGEAGNDLLAGSQGDDEIHGGDGDDLIFIGILEGSDRMFLGNGKDTVDGITAGSAFYVEGGEGDDQIISGLGEDTLFGGDGNDTLKGSEANDILDGDAGKDTALFTGDQSSYSLSISGQGITITDRRPDQNGTDTLIDMEFLKFDDGVDDASFNLSLYDGAADLSETELKDLVELYIAYFDRAPDAVGLFFWAAAFANGTTLEQAATLFIDQDETRALYPSELTNIEFAVSVYANVLGRFADPAGFEFWVSNLNSENVARDQFILAVLGGAKAAPPADATQDFTDQQNADRAYLETKTDIGAYFAVEKGMSNVDAASAAMALFDGTATSLDAALSAVDTYYDAALAPTDGAFLMTLVGVMETPDSL